MSNLLQNKTIAVVGGGGLLGKAFIKGIVEHGGKPLLLDIQPAASHAFLTELGLDATQHSHVIDITSAQSIQEAITFGSGVHGTIDAVVNTAYPRNKQYGRHFFDVAYSDFAENISLNLGGYFLVSQQFANYFQTKGQGNIINISSIYGVMAPRFEVYDNTPMTMPVEYAAIKAGLQHLSLYMAKYLKGSNIRVNCISPGGIFDNQDPIFVAQYKQWSMNKGMLDKEDIVGTLVFLLSDLSTYINGQNIIVDDGFSI